MSSALPSRACDENMTSPSPQVDFGGSGGGGCLADTFTPDVGHLRLRELKSFLKLSAVRPSHHCPEIALVGVTSHPNTTVTSQSPSCSHPQQHLTWPPLLLLGTMSSLGPGSPQPPGLPHPLLDPLNLCQLLSFSAQFLNTGQPSGIFSLPTCSSIPMD